MRQIDNMTPQEIDTLHLKGMIATTAGTSTQRQQGKAWDEKAEHENDLRHESRQDYETQIQQGS